MDPDIVWQLSQAKEAVLLLAVVIVLLCCYIVGQPEIDRRLTPKLLDDPTCPLHKRPRSQCDPATHEPD